jgi:hypothetical protein
VRELICLLIVLPMLVWGEQAPGLTSDGGSSGKAGAAVDESAASAERLSGYKAVDDWRHFAALIEANIKKHPPKYGEHAFADAVGVGIGGDIWALNSIAWDAFKKCDDKAVLKQALSWSELSIRLAQPTPDTKYPETEGFLAQFLDTKANLLYKLGRVDEAVVCEQAAIVHRIAVAKKSGRAQGNFLHDYNATVQKMRRGEPTWPVR